MSSYTLHARIEAEELVLKTFCSLVVTVFHRHSLRNLCPEFVVSLPALFETL